MDQNQKEKKKGKAAVPFQGTCSSNVLEEPMIYQFVTLRELSEFRTGHKLEDESLTHGPQDTETAFRAPHAG